MVHSNQSWGHQPIASPPPSWQNWQPAPEPSLAAFNGLVISRSTKDDSDSDSVTAHTKGSTSGGSDIKPSDSSESSIVEQNGLIPDHELDHFLTGRSDATKSSTTIPIVTKDVLNAGTVSIALKSLFGVILEGNVRGHQIRAGECEAQHSCLEWLGSTNLLLNSL